MNLSPVKGGGRSLSDDQIARELLEISSLIADTKSALDGSRELQHAVEGGLRQIGEAQQALEALAGRVAMAENDAMAHHEAVAHLREEVFRKVGAAHATFEKLLRASDALRVEFQRGEEFAAECRKVAAEVGEILGPIGGAQGLHTKLAKIDNLEAASRKRFLGHDKELEELGDLLATNTRRLSRLKLAMWALSALIGALAVMLMATLLR